MSNGLEEIQISILYPHLSKYLDHDKIPKIVSASDLEELLHDDDTSLPKLYDIICDRLEEEKSSNSVIEEQLDNCLKNKFKIDITPDLKENEKYRKLKNYLLLKYTIHILKNEMGGISPELKSKIIHVDEYVKRTLKLNYSKLYLCLKQEKINKDDIHSLWRNVFEKKEVVGSILGALDPSSEYAFSISLEESKVINESLDDLVVSMLNSYFSGTVDKKIKDIRGLYPQYPGIKFEKPVETREYRQIFDQVKENIKPQVVTLVKGLHYYYKNNITNIKTVKSVPRKFRNDSIKSIMFEEFINSKELFYSGGLRNRFVKKGDYIHDVLPAQLSKEEMNRLSELVSPGMSNHEINDSVMEFIGLESGDSVPEDKMPKFCAAFETALSISR